MSKTKKQKNVKNRERDQRTAVLNANERTSQQETNKMNIVLTGARQKRAEIETKEKKRIRTPSEI
jgi:hypothetical protein